MLGGMAFLRQKRGGGCWRRGYGAEAARTDDLSQHQ